jgi:two-component system nitrogen regulation sensor histidine kinase NtrY
LAIVKKIMEDHNGDLVLEDRDQGGARVSLVFHPLDKDVGGEGDAENPSESVKIAAGTLLHGS